MSPTNLTPQSPLPGRLRSVPSQRLCQRRLVHLDESAKQQSGLLCNSVNPELRSRAHHLEQSKRVKACWDIGQLDIFAIYTEVTRAHSSTTEALYGEAEGRSSQSIGIKTRRRQAEAEDVLEANTSREFDDVR